jgi:hypothetical protein
MVEKMNYVEYMRKERNSYGVQLGNLKKRGNLEELGI